MIVTKVNAIMFDKMLKNGLQNLLAHETEINKLNVFPVADGDTGSNMVVTIKNGLKLTKKTNLLSDYLSRLSEGMMFGARGNSGVILSQIMRGIYLALSNVGAAGTKELKKAFINGYKTAYDAVSNPVEGTMLTVAREGIEKISEHIKRETTVNQLLFMYISQMKNTLKKTPEMLPVLKKAGVIDSGAYGYIVIVEGMLKYLEGEIINESEKEVHAVKTADLPSSELFNADSSFDTGYCMEFVLQLLNGSGYRADFNEEAFKAELGKHGNSIVLAGSGTRYKVHIHTKKPSPVIELAQRYGEFISFKLENMQVQFNENLHSNGAVPGKKTEEKREEIPFGIVAILNGDGPERLYKELGCTAIVKGDSKNNASVKSILDGINAVNAKRTAIILNSKNNVIAAEQALTMTDKKDSIALIKTENIVEGYFALALDIGDETDYDLRLREMSGYGEGLNTVKTTEATKEYTEGELSCKEGDCITFIGDKMSAVAGDSVTAFIEGIAAVPDIDFKENMILFKNNMVTSDEESRLMGILEEKYPDIEVKMVDGNNSIYMWQAGLV
ncbi:MAG: DAK2 domain-containing protein [Eubacterium sp.]|nr:DAK2 domain-containing protein [Eubacterium sp.]